MDGRTTVAERPAPGGAVVAAVDSAAGAHRVRYGATTLIGAARERCRDTACTCPLATPTITYALAPDDRTA